MLRQLHFKTYLDFYRYTTNEKKRQSQIFELKNELN